MTVSTPPVRPLGTPSPTLQAIQAPVQDRLDQVAHEIRRFVTADVPLLAQVGDHLMTMKGKMFRPTLVLLASATDDAPQERAITLAAVVELVHLATLVHDDAVDHSVLRRGMPTLNAMFSHQVSVITGDFLYSVALAQLLKHEDIDAMRILVDASTQMTIGEMWQLSSRNPLESSEYDYEVVIRAKTASLIAAACRCGALCGAPHHEEALREYGDALGMAFQIADDLIDYTQVAATTGKPTGLDLREHKVTLPLIAALRTMSPAAKARVETFFALQEEPTDAQVAEIIGIVTEAGGLDYARRRGEEFAQKAEEALNKLPQTVARDALSWSISYVMERNA
jgi:octaprenyl-diphosphate synthase